MRNRRFIRLIILMLAVVLVVMTFSSCADNSESVQYLIYYVNSARDDIEYKTVQVENAMTMNSEELTQALITRMFDTDMSEEGFYSAKPQNVTLNEYTISDSTITFDFDSSYLEMTNVQEITLRAALVLTMIQQPDITQVMVTVEGSPLTDSNGIVIGVMNASNFVDVLLSEEGMLKQETDLTIYFTDETGTKLIPAKYHFTINNSNTSIEEYIVQQLIAGPAIDATYRTICADTKVISIVTSDSICYVNLDSSFLSQEQPASDEILIYSIVNSLCSLPYVSSVQFMVDGNSDVRLHTVTDLSMPFTRNRSLEQ